MRFRLPPIMPVACLTVSQTKLGDQDNSKQDKKMLCDTNKVPHGTTVEEDELEIVFEGDVGCDEVCDSDSEQDLDSEESDDEDYEEDSSVDESNESEEEGDSDPEPDTPTSCQETPFWFAHEDADQISEIFNSYTVSLHLDEEIKSCIRAPPPFVGKVQRIQVDNDLFTTLDQVSIYKRDITPLGLDLPVIRDVWLLTSWDVEEGLPLRCFDITTKDEVKKLWQGKVVGANSYLYCKPVYNTKRDWEFTVSTEENPITYTSHMHHTPQFSMYLPKRPVEASPDEDGEALV